MPWKCNDCGEVHDKLPEFVQCVKCRGRILLKMREPIVRRVKAR